MIAQEYSPEIQSCLVSRLAALHNFIHAFDPNNLPDDAKLEIPVWKQLEWLTGLQHRLSKPSAMKSETGQWSTGIQSLLLCGKIISVDVEAGEHTTRGCHFD